MNGILRNLKNLLIGIGIVYILYVFINFCIRYYTQANRIKKVFILTCLCLLSYFIMEAHAEQLRADAKWNAVLYGGYDHYNDPSVIEIQQRAERRGNHTMTANDFK